MNTALWFWSPYQLAPTVGPHKALAVQAAVDNTACPMSLLKSPLPELLIRTASSAASNTDVSNELALKIVNAIQNVRNAKHQLTWARIQKADKNMMTKSMLEMENVEHKLQDLRMQREKEKIEAQMKREGKTSEVKRKRVVMDKKLRRTKVCTEVK
ncbi:hypothetical protein V5O48_017122, partial [Marasmius crinis-equi]